MDIKDAEGLFAEGPIRVCEVRTGGGESVIALQADELEEKDDYLEVLATAERLLDYINGALFLADMERRPLRVLSGGTVRARARRDRHL
jgi:mannose/fructose-specific phosphotransferase system component IIA